MNRGGREQPAARSNGFSRAALLAVALVMVGPSGCASRAPAPRCTALVAHPTAKTRCPPCPSAPLRVVRKPPVASRPILAGPRFGLQRITAADAGLDPLALTRLLERAEREKSSALVVLREGKLVVERYWEGGPDDAIVSMSVSKSVVNLAIGLLLADKKLRSLDQSAADFIPSWRHDPRKQITIRHLLNHTSGLETRRAHRLRGHLRYHARRTKLLFPPGERFHYNNNAVDMLALVVHHASGLFLDDFLRQRLFWPAGIERSHWLRYADGHPRAAGELWIRPVELAKLGQLLLQRGRWGETQLLDPQWIAQSVRAGQSIFAPCGLLWWREGDFRPRLDRGIIDSWLKDGADPVVLKPLAKLLGRTFRDERAYRAALLQQLGAKGRRGLDKLIGDKHLLAYRPRLRGRQRGFAARGWLGQYLVVLPQKGLVGVRMRAIIPEDRRRDETDHFPDFGDYLDRLVPGAKRTQR